MPVELVVVTPEGEALSEQVEQVVLPGEAGEFGVLESHERFLTPLVLGPMRIERSGGAEWAALSGGFAQVDGKRVVVLVDHCALASEIDSGAVRQRRAEVEEAIEALPESESTELERERLTALMARADLELDVAAR